MTMKHLIKLGTTACMLAGLLFVSGCVTDRGNSGGRIDISATTEAELDSAKVLPVSLVEFSDQASRRIGPLSPRRWTAPRMEISHAM